MIKLNKDFMLGAAVGFGAGFLTARSKLIESQSFKGLVKSLMKKGIESFETSKEGVMRGAEILEDLFFEVRTEMNSAEMSAEAGTKDSTKHAHATTKSTTHATGEESPAPVTPKRKAKPNFEHQ